VSVRIASLLPSATEIVCALGLVDDVVGVSHECDYPPEVRGKPVLTEARLDSTATSGEIDAEVRGLVAAGLSIYRVLEDRLADLKPDVIVTQDTCQVCAVSLADVRRAACRVLGAEVEIVSLAPLSVDDVLDDVLRVGRATGSLVQAEMVVTGMRARLDRLRALTTGLPRPRVLHLEWLDPPMPAGHWTPELLRIAGGDPIMAHDHEPTRATTWDDVAQADPEVVLVAPCGFGVERALAELPRFPMLRELRAHREGRVHVLDGNAYFNRPGPRLVDSAEIAAAVLHPGSAGASS
jgi:iron complex transport system substrate-binding protein